MTVASARSHSTAGAREFFLRLLFAVLALVPVTVLFVQVRESVGTQRSAADLERNGIEYLTALGPLTVALADAQSAAVTGTSPRSAALTDAVVGVTAVDDRLGESLGSRDRWRDLRTKITALTGRAPGDPIGAYADYGALTDLLLGLFTRVRETSGLIRDPGVDTSYLQDGASRQLPLLIVAVGRLDDQAALALRRTKADQVRTTAELLDAVGDANTPARDLVEDVQRAVDGAQGTILDADLVGQLDKFRIAADALSASTVLVDGDITPADVDATTTLRSALTTAAGALSRTMLSRIDQGVADRAGSHRRTLLLAELAAVLALLVLLAPVVVTVVGVRRARRRGVAEEPLEDPSQELPPLPTAPAAAHWERVGASR